MLKFRIYLLSKSIIRKKEKEQNFKKTFLIKRKKNTEKIILKNSSDLAPAVEFVGEFDLAEGHCFLHPVGTEVRGVWVDVHTVGGGGLSLTPSHPVPIDVFPAMRVHLHKVQQ